MCRACSDSEWDCHDGKRCIKKQYVCDNTIHCSDGSDEKPEVCAIWQCSAGRWKCLDNLWCISSSKVCDERSDCKDGSDETDEACSNCPEGFWKCGSGECITADKVCDDPGIWTDCDDESDEDPAMCAHWNCTDNFWKCDNGVQCLHMQFVCNWDNWNHPSCSDDSDEGPHCEDWNCSAGMWKCKTGGKCIKIENVCDSLYNTSPHGCEDKSDEDPVLCAEWICPSGYWKCRDNLTCLAQSRIMNYWDDCRDGSDEDPKFHVGRTCPAGYLLCADGEECIKAEYCCDGRTADDRLWEDCKDGSDEGDMCEEYTCLDDYWKCGDNKQCILAEKVCDGEYSDDSDLWFDEPLEGCMDSSDEHNILCGCPEVTDQCQWQCLDGQGCIDAKYVCDGNYGCINIGGEDSSACDGNGCNDKSDELQSVCERWNGTWPCTNDKCIEYTQVCDGKVHCLDGTDELSCQNWTCSEMSIKCQDGLQCIFKGSVCDGHTDCRDFSDEDSGFCETYKCLPGYTKCANNMQCIKTNLICDGNFDCKDISDELCNSPCLKRQLGRQKPIIKKCIEYSDTCVPIDRYCDGVADCPEASDETQSGCTCEDWGLTSCNHTGHMFCLNPEWLPQKSLNDLAMSCWNDAVAIDQKETTKNISGVY